MSSITRRNSPLTWSPSKSLRRLSRKDPLISPEARATSGRETETSGHDTPTQSRLMTDAQIRKRAVEIIELFPNLEPKLRERAGALSGGEQQMVALAKSMMLDPDILLIDEPSAGLAPKLVDNVFSKIVEINASGTAVIMVEQNAKKALAIAHRGYVLETGRNRFEGTGQELLHNTDVAKLYLGG